MMGKVSNEYLCSRSLHDIQSAAGEDFPNGDKTKDPADRCGEVHANDLEKVTDRFAVFSFVTTCGWTGNFRRWFHDAGLRMSYTVLSPASVSLESRFRAEGAGDRNLFSFVSPAKPSWNSRRVHILRCRRLRVVCHSCSFAVGKNCGAFRNFVACSNA